MLRRICSVSSVSPATFAQTAAAAVAGATSSSLDRSSAIVASLCNSSATPSSTAALQPSSSLLALRTAKRFAAFSSVSKLPAIYNTKQQTAEHYRSDDSLTEMEVDLIHQLHQICGRNPVPLSAIAGKLTKDSVRCFVSRYGSIESFVMLHPKYLKIENGNVGVVHKYKAAGSTRLMDEITTFIKKNNNSPQRPLSIFGALSQRGRIDFLQTKLKSITDYARLRPVYFTVSDTGNIALTAEGIKQAEAAMGLFSPSSAKTAAAATAANKTTPTTNSTKASPTPSTPASAEAALLEALNESNTKTAGQKKVMNLSNREMPITSSDDRPVDLLSLAWRSIPCSFFIPLARAFSEMESLDKRLTTYGIDGLLLQLRALPPRFLDLVSFAGPSIPRNELHLHTYVRLTCADVVIKDVETGDSRCAEYEVVDRLAKSLAKYLEPHQGEIRVDQVPALIPQTLVAELPFKGPALMLLFDRMQHLFKINKQTMTVALSGDALIDSKELTILTTPMPIELRKALEIVGSKPIKPAEFEAQFPPEMKERVIKQFGSLPRFINAHKLEVFVRNGLLMTPAQSAAMGVVDGATLSRLGNSGFSGHASAADSIVEGMENTSGGGSGGGNNNDSEEYDFENEKPHRTQKVVPALPIARMTPKQLADYVYECMPNDRCVSWSSLRSFVDLAVFQHAVFAQGDPRDFFIARPDLFRVYDPAFVNGFIIGKPHLVQPHGTWDEVKDIKTVLKMIAVVTVGGVAESAALQLLPRDVRAIVKRCGGFEHLVGQVPQWFDCRNPSGLPGHSIVTYIGHKNPSLKQLPSPYPTYIPCIPESHNIRVDSYKYTPVENTSDDTNSDINDPYADYEEEGRGNGSNHHGGEALY